ncbi:MAG: phosphate acyltransferase [Deltaproteobacteria bacterium]
MYRSFHDITSTAKKLGPVKVAGLFPHSRETVQSAVDAMQAGLITPILVGVKDVISKSCEDTQVIGKIQVIDQPDPQKAADLCMEMTARGDVALVMKGNIVTTYLYRALIRKTKERAPDQTPCTLCFHEMKGLHKIFVITDPGVNILPDIELKKKILTNAINVVRKLGCHTPRVMALAAPTLNGAKSNASREVEQLRDSARQGYFGDCEFLEASNLMAAFPHGKIKEEKFPDIFLVPNIEAGNILVKSIDHLLMGVRQCATIGGDGLITLTPSRSDGYEARMVNIALGIVLSTSTRSR